jgi:fructose-bisphosphate aldolase class II
MLQLRNMVYTAAANTKVPITLHLDHGRDISLIKKCILCGWTSVMYDGSHLPLDQNIKNTAMIVKFAHSHGVSVEGELGTIGGAEEKIVARNIIYTDPDAAVEFVKKTKVDSLAIAIGTSHGAYKFKGKSTLNFKILKEIKSRLKMPLVLHGASSIPQDIVKKANTYGAKLESAKGVSEANIRQAVRLGINKVNIDSDTRMAFNAALRETLAKNPKEFDPRKILSPARELITEITRKKMRILGSSGKA